MPTYIVYTCITQNYDWLLPPLHKESGIEYLCFTDNPDIENEGWTVFPIDDSLKHLPPNLINRHYKLFPHLYLPESEWSVYIDGNMRILDSCGDLIDQVRKKDAVMACPQHPRRDNIFEEADACLRLNKFSEKDKTVIQNQLNDYTNEGFSHVTPLSANYIIIRNHNNYRLQETMYLSSLRCGYSRLELGILTLALGSG